MYLNHTDMESVVGAIVERIHGDFDRSWLKHPGSAELLEAPLVRPEVPTPAHVNKVYEICYSFKGDVLLQLGQRVVRLAEGQMFIVPPNTLHYEMPNNVYSGDAVWFIFHSDRVHVNMSETRPDGSFTILHGQQAKLDAIYANMALSDLTKELKSAQSGAEILLKCTMLQLLVTVLREMKKQEQKMTPAQWRESVVREVMVYLQKRQGSIPELNDLADHCAMSPNHLNSIFKSVTGKTITAYCSDLRIEQAKYLLEATPMKMRELSEQLGYYDQYHFCKAFKKATGLSPSQYRAEKSEK